MILFQCDGCGKTVPSRVIGGESLAPSGWSTRMLESAAWRGGEHHVCCVSCQIVASRRIRAALGAGETSLHMLPPREAFVKAALSLVKDHQPPQNGQNAPDENATPTLATNARAQRAHVQEQPDTEVLGNIGGSFLDGGEVLETEADPTLPDNDSTEDEE